MCLVRSCLRGIVLRLEAKLGKVKRRLKSVALLPMLQCWRSRQGWVTARNLDPCKAQLLVVACMTGAIEGF